MTTSEQARRNLSPHKAAVAAMWMWGNEYAKQSGGSMDFWDEISPKRQQLCRDLVARLEKAPAEEQS